MYEEEAFQAALDRDPDCRTTRLVFADWLDERDDPRGPGYRAMGTLGLRARPILMSSGETLWILGSTEGVVHKSFTNWDSLPGGWMEAIPWTHRCDWYTFRYKETRRELDDAAARAWPSLDPGVQSSILSTMGQQAPVGRPA